MKQENTKERDVLLLPSVMVLFRILQISEIRLLISEKKKLKVLQLPTAQPMVRRQLKWQKMQNQLLSALS
jgi:hypothetical protein